MDQNRARLILDNPLVAVLLDEFEHKVFREWCESMEPQRREAIHAKYQALRELRGYINNKCEGIASGADSISRNTRGPDGE